MSDNEIKITIKDVNIPLKWRRKLKTLQNFEKETYWKVGTLEEEEVIYYERQVLDQDLQVLFSEHGRIYIWSGKDIDRANLAYLDRLMGSKADIDVSDKGHIELMWDTSTYQSEYEKYPKFKTKDDITSPLFNHKVRIRS